LPFFVSLYNWISSCIGRCLGRGALLCRRMKVWRKRTVMAMLMLVNPPQQQLSRPIQQRHTRLCRAHRASEHSLQRDLRMRMNPTMVVGETFCTTRLRRAHRTSGHSLQRDLRTRMNPTMVVGETFCTRSAASHMLVASYPLFSPLDITCRFL